MIERLFAFDAVLWITDSNCIGVCISCRFKSWMYMCCLTTACHISVCTFEEDYYISLDSTIYIINFVNYPFLDSNIPLSPAYWVYMSQLIQYSRTCNSYQDFLQRSVLLTRKHHGFIETRLRSTLNYYFFFGGRYYHLTLPYRFSVTTMANDICRPWYCCHEYVSFLDTT